MKERKQGRKSGGPVAAEALPDFQFARFGKAESEKKKITGGSKCRSECTAFPCLKRIVTRKKKQKRNSRTSQKFLKRIANLIVSTAREAGRSKQPRGIRRKDVQGGYAGREKRDSNGWRRRGAVRKQNSPKT